MLFNWEHTHTPPQYYTFESTTENFHRSKLFETIESGELSTSHIEISEQLAVSYPRLKSCGRLKSWLLRKLIRKIGKSVEYHELGIKYRELRTGGFPWITWWVRNKCISWIST